MRTCQLIIGRLVAHPCGRKAGALCAACGRPTCERHMDPGSRCLQCLGRHAPAPAPVVVTEAEMMAFDERDLAAFEPAPGAGLARPSYEDS